MSAKIDRLIINSPYVEPTYHWEYNKDTKSFDKVEGRRSAGYLVASKDKKDFEDDSGTFIEIELVNKIRPKVKAWREAGYPGATNVTRKLLAHWHDSEARNFPFFFCQLDAIETLIWLNESYEGRSTLIRGDSGKFKRLCTKLCTGGGKTIVMAMLIAWSVCNKVRDIRSMGHSKNILIIAPNLTVKKRLQVLDPKKEINYYEQFDIVPVEIKDLMSQARVVIHNWQALAWDSSNNNKSVDKRGPMSDGAYARKVLKNFYEHWLVINDEAHHAYRVQETSERLTREEKEEQRQATIWIQGLDRIHNVRRILTCYDFSATPFIPGGRTNEESLFSWIVSDFSLSDGIESGLVKTPRIVVRDNVVPDASTYKTKLYHKSSAHETESLPDLVRNAYSLLAADWLETYNNWKNSGKIPVMISVANCTTTAARVEHFFRTETLNMPEELCEAERLLRIDSKKLQDESDAEGERLREMVDTVGQEGKLGAQLSNIISVGMLSEGWDAKTVTHIMGLRAFSSQLLCEQVVGRGLRNGFFEPEYVNVFGVPFSFLPHEDPDSKGGTVPPKNTTEIKPLEELNEFRITWPNITRLEYISGQKLKLDKVKDLELNAEETRINAEIAPVLNGKANLAMCSDIDLEKTYEQIRLQQIIFQTAAKVYDEMSAVWKDKSPRILLLGQIIRLVQEYLRSRQIKINPPLFEVNDVRRRILYAMNMDKIIKNLWESIRSENAESIVPVYDTFKRVRSTGDMSRWWTVKPNEITQKSHINRCVFDSTWEATEAYRLDKNPHVKAWAKNDHLGFYIYYVYNGEIKKYLPDFLIVLDNDITLVLEVKGRLSEQDKEKKSALEDWIKAVNSTKDWGEWRCDISRSAADIDGIIERHCGH